MNIKSVVGKLLVTFPFFLASQALAGNTESPKFLEQVRGLVQHCAVQPARGPLESKCTEVLVKGSQAQLQLNGEWYSANIVDSEDSDGGDLNNIFVQDQNGTQVAELHNALAFGDILLGLAGGQIALHAAQ